VNLPDGIHHLNREQYDALGRVKRDPAGVALADWLSGRVNWSTLKWMLRSPAHYRHAALEEFEDSDPKRLGRVVHLAVFEPEWFDERVARWDGKVRNGKAWDAFKAEHAHREILTAAAYDEAIAISAAVKRHPLARPLLTGGRAELSVLWTHTPSVSGQLLPSYQVACKGRLDYLLGGEGEPIVDLKATRDASPEGFGRQAWSFRYDAQAAFYVDGVAAVTGKRRPYVLIAVEETPPYAVGVYQVPDVILAGGRELYTNLLERVAECRAKDSWPDYGEQVRELELPRWATPWPADEDLSAADLAWGA
jgi:hypothetical protein